MCVFTLLPREGAVIHFMIVSTELNWELWALHYWVVLGEILLIINKETNYFYIFLIVFHTHTCMCVCTCTCACVGVYVSVGLAHVWDPGLNYIFVKKICVKLVFFLHTELSITVAELSVLITLLSQRETAPHLFPVTLIKHCHFLQDHHKSTKKKPCLD